MGIIKGMSYSNSNKKREGELVCGRGFGWVRVWVLGVYVCVCIKGAERDPRERKGLNVDAECLTSSAGSGECSVGNVSI
jgi:hypothetical protein